MSAKRAGKVMLGAEALSVNKRDGVVEVETSAGVIRGRTSLVTTPLPHAAKILEGGTSAAYAQSLNRIRYLGNVCLVLEMTRSLSELYWLNVNDPSFPYVGIIEHTNFEPRESYGGTPHRLPVEIPSGV
jgi:predicted NAD/FAD-dependent oxidoreductase